MSPRPFALVAVTVAIAACSSAPPSDDTIPTLPGRVQDGTEPVGRDHGQDDPDLVGEQTPAPSAASNDDPDAPEEPVDPGQTCTSTCTSAGAKKCANGTSYQVCKEVQPGCLRWTTAKACGASMVCTGAGACSCDHQCTLDANTCASPTQWKTCVKNANGCRVWSAVKDCVRATPSPGCYVYQKACFGTCNDGCTTEGSVSCTGPTSYVECVRNSSDQCLKIESGSCKTSALCFSDPKVCANGT